MPQMGMGTVRRRARHRNPGTDSLLWLIYFPTNPAIPFLPHPLSSYTQAQFPEELRLRSEQHSPIIKSQLSKTNLLTMAKHNEEGWKHTDGYFPFTLLLSNTAGTVSLKDTQIYDEG